MPAAPSEQLRPKGSNTVTNDVIFGLIKDLITPKSSILDFGAGNGFMCWRIGELLEKKGMLPNEHLAACEIAPEKFQYGKVKCHAIATDSKIPFNNENFDIIYAIEVLEHAPRPYDFFKEAYAKLKPGGRLIFSVPNTLQLQSRLKFLLTGFGEMYPPPSIHDRNAGRICGHIMPLNYPYFHYGLRKAGFSGIEFHADRRKKGALFLTALLYPFIRAGSRGYDKDLKKYDPEVWEETKMVLTDMNSLDMLTSRSCIITARR